MKVFIAKITNAENVKKILNLEEFTHLDIYNFRDEVKVGNDIFFVFGGDKTQISWEQGVIGFGKVTQAPYDFGYNSQNPRYFKIDIKPEFVLQHPIPPKETKLHPKYQHELYDVPYVGANHFPNQAIAKAENESAKALFSLFYDYLPLEQKELIPSEKRLEKKKVITEKLDKQNILSTDITQLPKPFLLLAGVSGTGKSRFVREQVPEEERKDRYQLVAVRPDWHEPSDLLGYVSRLSGQAQYVMTDVLKFIVKAWKAIAKADLLHNNEVSGLKERLEQVPPYWLCLDEMNLAPVEQYFADYLAVIESRKWVWNDNEFSYQTEALLSPTAWEDIANFKEQLDVDDDLWDFFQTNGIGIPFNLIVAGTVNMDETTHAFSRKVLDRALSFDFSEFYPNDFDAFFEPKTQPKRLSYPIYSQVTQNDFDGLEFAEKSIEFLTTLNSQFENTPFKLGYRALNELLLSVKSFQPQTIEELQAVWDDFVMLKVLPRIEGDENKLYSATQEGLSVLDDIETVLKKYLSEIWQDGDFVRIDFWQTEAKGDVLKTKCRTKPKLANMKAQLINRGIVSFW